MLQIRLAFAIGWMFVAGVVASPEQGPTFSAGGPDAAAYGQSEHYPVGSPETLREQKYLVGAFSHFDVLFPSRMVKPSAQAWLFRRPAELPKIRYFHAGSSFSLDDYLTHVPVTGLLIAKDDQILYEGYQYGRTDKDRLTSQSMAKTFTAMLAGVALSERAIGSVVDPAAKYIPELKDKAYGKIVIRDLLHMSSGMSCDQHGSDVQITFQTLAAECKTVAPAGTTFAYSSEDSQLLGLIVKRAVKVSLTQYLQERIWKQIGTEASATWTIDTNDQETAFCCLNAVLRDYGRFARLLAFDGAWNGKQLIPKDWILEATTVKDSDTQLVPGKPMRFFGYGYQVCILPGARRMFALLGSNGQRIFVDPQSKLFLVQTAVTQKAIDPKADAETVGLWLSLLRQFGG